MCFYVVKHIVDIPFCMPVTYLTRFKIGAISLALFKCRKFPENGENG